MTHPVVTCDSGFQAQGGHNVSFQIVWTLDEIVYMFAHEIGHNLNALHDETDGPKYIMSGGGANTSFSESSIHAIQQEIDKLRVDEKARNVKCLKNISFQKNTYDDLILSETKNG